VGILVAGFALAAPQSYRFKTLTGSPPPTVQDPGCLQTWLQAAGKLKELCHL